MPDQATKPEWSDAIKEVMFDLSANYGVIRQKMMDNISAYQARKGGSSAVAYQLAEWSEEFEARWLGLPEDHPDRENYYEVIDDFFADRLSKDMASLTGFPVEQLRAAMSGFVSATC